jgi:hypothetical protein
MFDVALGFVASVYARSAVVRFFAWASIAIILALLEIGPGELARAHGGRAELWLVFGCRVVLGFLASGVGTLGGCLVRRAERQQP